MLPIFIIESKAEFQLEVRDHKTVFFLPIQVHGVGLGWVNGPQVNNGCHTLCPHSVFMCFCMVLETTINLPIQH
jgi:hypothetical protein